MHAEVIALQDVLAIASYTAGSADRAAEVEHSAVLRTVAGSSLDALPSPAVAPSDPATLLAVAASSATEEEVATGETSACDMLAMLQLPSVERPRATA